MNFDFSMVTVGDITEYFSVIIRKIVLFFNPEYDGTIKLGSFEIIIK